MKTNQLTTGHAAREAGKLATLADAIAFVIGGLRSGSVKANAILNMEPNAENYDMVSMEDYLTKKLNDCRYTVPPPKPKEEKTRRKRQQPPDPMPNESQPTPETDNAERALGIFSCILYGPAKRLLLKHARKLERERDAARAAIQSTKQP